MSETTDRQAELEEAFGGEELRDPDDPDELIEQYEAARLTVEPILGETRRPFEHAAATVADCLTTVQQTLVFLRAQREEINDEIRTLVAEEELLMRMARIAERAATTEGNPPNEQPPPDPPG